MQANTYLNIPISHQITSVSSINLTNLTNSTDLNIHQVRLNLGIVFPYERTSFRQDSNRTSTCGMAN